MYTGEHSYEVLQDPIDHLLKQDWRIFPRELQPAALVYVEWSHKGVYLYSSCNETCQKPLHKSMRENILQPPVSSMMASIRGIGDENRCLLADNPVIRVQMKRPILFRNNSNW